MPMQIFTKRYKKGVWDLKAFVDSGGMPSSHSSLCAVRCTEYAARTRHFGHMLLTGCSTCGFPAA